MLIINFPWNKEPWKQPHWWMVTRNLAHTHTHTYVHTYALVYSCRSKNNYLFPWTENWKWNTWILRRQYSILAIDFFAPIVRVSYLPYFEALSDIDIQEWYINYLWTNNGSQDESWLAGLQNKSQQCPYHSHDTSSVLSIRNSWMFNWTVIL